MGKRHSTSTGKTMEKPAPEIFYDFRRAMEWISRKYQINQDDLCGWAEDKSKPYRSFWAWLTMNQTVEDGSFIVFSREMCDTIQEEWARTVYGYYLDEFAQEKNRVLFWYDW